MCTRVLFRKDEKDSPVIIDTGRTLDWAEPFPTNLWAFPAGVERRAYYEGDFTWQAKYKSIVASVCNEAFVDGMNEKGLVVNALYLAESKYYNGTLVKDRTPMSIMVVGHYLADNFANVKEAVEGWTKGDFQIIGATVPGGDSPAAVHFSLSDSEGNSAIFEYIDGYLHVTTNWDYTPVEGTPKDVFFAQEVCDIMTNSPIYSEQVKLNYYWEWQWGGDKPNPDDPDEKPKVNRARTQTLPGTIRSPDRFARASFYERHVKKSSEPEKAAAQTFGIMRSVSTPLDIATDPNEPNNASTLWISTSDQLQKRYYFNYVERPNVFWVDLAELDLNDADYILVLPYEIEKEIDGKLEWVAAEGSNYAGEVSTVMNAHRLQASGYKVLGTYPPEE